MVEHNERNVRRLFAAVALVALVVLIAAVPAEADKKPDLVEKAVAAPAAATAGASFEVSDTVVNKGKKRAGKSTTRFVLSKSDSIDDGEVSLTGSRKVPKLKPGKKSSGITSVTVPANTQAGTWFVLACADADDAVKEKSETNNCKAGARTISIAAAKTAKLAINPPSWNAGTIFAGAAVNKTFTVTNPGTAPTSAISVAISGTGTAPYSTFSPTTCPGTALAPGGSCTVTVAFGSNTEGSYTASLDVSATTGGAVHAPMTGTISGSP